MLNIAAYRFVPLADLPALRLHLLASAQHQGLKGKVVLAEEGINLSVAGAQTAVQTWWASLITDPRFAGMPVKRSFSERVPFKRMLVKIKTEIIRMNMPAIRPAAQRASAVSPRTLRRWLDQGHCDEGRPVLMLDTRNGFEVDAGAFEGALDWRLKKFSDFPAALAAQREKLQGKTVVSYCTGGIRCEKAALVMQQLGVAHSHQLDGGILQYFEDTAEQDGHAPHWRGNCVVFDERVAVQPSLEGTCG